MKPRIIAGSAKGINLEVPDGIRPITDTAKSSMFSMLADDILEKRVLDLFAGSGSIGLEALSRGAKSCIFVDNNQNTIEILKRNIETTKLAKNSQIVKMAVGTFVKVQLPEEYDIIFADPPYRYFKKRMFLKKFLNSILPLIPNGGGILIKHPLHVEIPKVDGLKHADTRCFGQVCFSTWVKM